MYSENLAMSLHTYKNIFWTTQQQFELIKTAINTNDTSHTIEYIDAGIDLMKSQIKSTQSAIKIDCITVDAPIPAPAKANIIAVKISQ